MELHTSRATLLLFSFLIGGCALFEPPKEEKKTTPYTQVFDSSYDEVWRAVQKSMVSYPIQLNNIDRGIIESDVIKGAQAWRPPFEKDNKRIGYKYSLKVNVVKGQVKGRESTRVTLLKKIGIEKDFFTGEVELASDGFEEKSILYRIDREIKLERALKKAFESKNI